jgi:hypothetical protein
MTETRRITLLTVALQLLLTIAAKPEPPVKKVLTLDAAKKIAAAAEAEAKKRGAIVVIVIVDDGGHLLLLERTRSDPYAALPIRPSLHDAHETLQRFLQCRYWRRWLLQLCLQSSTFSFSIPLVALSF